MPGPWGGFSWEGLGLGASEGKGGSRGVMMFLSSPTALATWVSPLRRRLTPACSISVRGVAERTPSFMYPQGTASSQMVLRGMDLLLECIASGV